MRRFYAENCTGDEVTVTGDDARHIARVLRMNAGDKVVLCDGTGTDCVCTLLSVGEVCRARVISAQRSNSEPLTRITLYQGIPKGSKTEEILQKCTEVGVTDFRLVPFSRCVARIDEPKKLARYQITVREACKQCGRAYFPSVELCAPQDITSHQLLITAYEGESERLLSECLKPGITDIGLVIGPEGGLEEKEVEALKNKGAVTVSLGRRILRTETAGTAAAAVILAICGGGL